MFHCRCGKHGGSEGRNSGCPEECLPRSEGGREDSRSARQVAHLVAVQGPETRPLPACTKDSSHHGYVAFSVNLADDQNH